MAETATEKKVREDKEAEEAQKAEAARQQQETEAKILALQEKGLEENRKRAEAEENAKKDSSISGETASPNPSGRAPSLLDQIMAENAPVPTFVPTYEQGRWKVGDGHSMVDVFVQGQEIDLQAILSLGSTEDETRAIITRLINLGAIVRMADHEPKGGTATGRLAPLSATQENFDPSGQKQTLMGSDIRERIAGQATPSEMLAMKKG